MTIEVAELYTYPVKSLKGIALDQATLTAKGLIHDRRWMVVRSNGQFVTQRDLPRLSLVGTSLEKSGVRLSLEGHGAITIPFNTAGGERIQTRVWGTLCETLDEGEEISRWLTSAVQSSDLLKLVHMMEGFVRPQNKPQFLGKDTHTFFADAAPFLVASETSLDALNRELETRGHPPVPMNRFRPNIVLRGLRPFAEHTLNKMQSATCRLKFCHPCERCVVTTINQDTAEVDPEKQPFRTLREINPMPGQKPAPAFGQNAILEKGDRAVMTRGEPVSVS